MDEQKKQTIFDLPKVIAIGIASPAATLLTSRFGIAGTLLGLALSAMILTAVADFLKVYLARTSQAAHTAVTTKVPGAMKAPRGFFLPARLFRRKGRARAKAPYHGYSSPPGGRWRRWFLFVGRSVVAAGISFVLALGVVTAIEHSAGKSLSCLVWEECPEESSSEEGADTSDESTTTRPSIFGGGPTAGSDAASVGLRPAGPQQQPTSPVGAPKPPAASQAAGSQGSAPGAGDQWQEQSDKQQEQYYYYSEEYEQQSSSSPPPSTTDEAQWREYQDGGSQYMVPWSS